MKELVETIAKALVDSPDEVVVSELKTKEKYLLLYMLPVTIWEK